MEKINIAELLKDCPKGMELESPVLIGKISFNRIIKFERYPIEIKVGDDTYCLTKYGQHIDIDSFGCLIYPKGKTTWDGFVPPCKFKDGDIVVSGLGNIAIVSDKIGDNLYKTYCVLYRTDMMIVTTGDSVITKRFATEEEKEKLFKAIKDNGYRWNADTKTLEKEEKKKDKFDITTLKPFDKVLVRDFNYDYWIAANFSHYAENVEGDYHYYASGSCFEQCVPYEGNEHLLGEKDDCDEYYKTWQ